MSHSAFEIAVIGIAAELPGGTSDDNLQLDSFFDFLLAKGEAYEKIPIERFNIEHIKGRGLGQVVSDTGAFLKNVQLFDSLEFGVTNKDIRAMPIGTRKLIETAFLALLDSGINYRGKNVGSFMAGIAHDVIALSGHDDNEAGSFASVPSTIANRVAYHLDLRGPSVPTDTACSSSLVATHLAVQALRNGECEAAVVGGAQINHRFTEWAMYTQGGILSPDGKCKPFDKSANGFGRGEGVVSMVLKPLDAAIRNHDKIYATILGTGINTGGSMAPVHAPVASAQQDAMKRAFSMAQRLPQEVDFLELHATGTASGDPTEANWVGEQFKRDDELLIGSVKGNIGHLEISSFLASMCKVISMFKTGVIAPNVNLINPNPAIKWKEYKFRVPLEPERLPCRSTSGRSLIAMTSSGITGSNGHCVVEGPPRVLKAPNCFWLPGSTVPSLLVAAGLTPRSASAISDELKDLITDHHPHSLARIYGRRARSLTWRSFALAKDGKVSRFSEPTLIPKSTPPLVFVFSGQGPQHFRMGRELFETNAVFRSSVLELDATHLKVAGYSLIERYGLFSDKSGVDILGETWPISVTLPSLAVLHIALFDTLASIGVKPDVIIGHSAGETAALYASGAAPKYMAVELAIARGKAMALLEDKQGTMAAISCSPEEGQKIVDEVIQELGPGPLQVGCYNTPGSITLSGRIPHIDLAVAKAQIAGIFARRLRTRVPVHSTMMDLCEKEYRAFIAEVFERYEVTPPTVKMYSTKTGKAYEELFTADYFWDSTRGPVRFTQAMHQLTHTYPAATYLEIGPHPVLSSYLSTLAGKESTVACPLRRAKTVDQKLEVQGLLDALGKLTTAGHDCVDFDTVYGGFGDASEPPLSFPFARKDIPYATQSAMMVRQMQHRNGPMNYPQLYINSKTHPDLADHIIKGEPIMPSAGYLEMALEFGAQKLWNVQFISILGLSSDKPTPIHVELDGPKWTVKSASAYDQFKTWPIRYDRVHATGYLSKDEDSVTSRPSLPLSEIRGRLASVDMRDFYKDFSSFAQYGPMYQRVTACYRGVNPQGQDEVLVQVRGSDTDISEIDGYRLHPAILDAALHVGVHPIMTGYKNDSRYYLPSKFRAVEVHTALKKPFPKTVFSHVTLMSSTPNSLTYDIVISDEEGVLLFTIDGLEVALHGSTVKKVTKRFEVVHAQSDITLQRTTRVVEAPKSESIPLILEYVRGEELDLQKLLAPLDVLSPQSLWFHATAEHDGDASLGFTRSLRREYPFWAVNVTVFDRSWTLEEKTAAIYNLMAKPDCENELYVDAAGKVSAPRIVPSSAPVSRIAFKADSPWIKEGSQIVQTSEPTASSQHLTINVTGAVEPVSNIWAFIGRVKGSSRRVAGITNGPLSNVVVAHRGSIIDIPEGDNNQIPDILAHAIVGLALGGAITNPERLSETSIAIENFDSEVTSRISQICFRLGVQLTVIPCSPSVADLQTLSATSPNIIIAASRTAVSSLILKDFTAPGGKVFFWQDAEVGIPRILSIDPWSVGDALRASVECASNSVAYKAPLELIGIEIPEEVESRLRLFSADKAYVLIGGIGSLGVEIAYWMYQHGARYIVLTSRSGRDSVAQKGSILSKRILANLEALSDLTLRLVAVDALSTQDMSSLIGGLGLPLGGCMLLALVLADRSFASQTRETFDIPFIPKTGAFQVLENVVSLETLDFLITFSSVSGMFGNAGQTNYASANTALAGMTRKYKNAFCIIVPFIIDSSGVMAYESHAERVNHLANWGMVGSELCEYLGDGILKLRDSPVWQYVPDFDWSLVQANMGPSTVYADLVIDDGSQGDQFDEAKQPASLKDIVCKVLDLAPEDLSPDVPFTAYGLDSLSAASLSYALSPLLRISQIQLLADISLRHLEERLEEAVLEAPPAPTADKSETKVEEKETRPKTCGKLSKTDEMVEMVERYAATFPDVKVSTATQPARKTVFVTGTTGSLGAHMIARLLPSSDVEKVYVFMRKREGEVTLLERQRTAFKERGLDDVALKSPKLVLVEGDLSTPGLGIPRDVFRQLMNTITHIAHIGWTIDFGLPLSAFDSDVRGLRHLIDLALGEGERPVAKLIYTSSAGLFRNFDSLPLAPIPEEFIQDPAIAVGIGYCESKWVAEQIVAAAAKKTALKPSVIRPTQLTGGLNGMWKQSEWFPSLVSASVALRCFPETQDSCVWLPADTAASAVIDMFNSSKPVLHLQNPNVKPLSDITSIIARDLHLPQVPYSEWLCRLEDESAKVARGETQASLNLQSGIRLSDVFHAPLPASNPRRAMTDSFGIFCKMDMESSLDESATLQCAGVHQIEESDILRWISHWKSIGFLRSNDQ